eukprot:scaffold300794_cov30-Tisochrysis_lutea.AAC.4
MSPQASRQWAARPRPAAAARTRGRCSRSRAAAPSRRPRTPASPAARAHSAGCRYAPLHAMLRVRGSRPRPAASARSRRRRRGARRRAPAPLSARSVRGWRRPAGGKYPTFATQRHAVGVRAFVQDRVGIALRSTTLSHQHHFQSRVWVFLMTDDHGNLGSHARAIQSQHTV